MSNYTVELNHEQIDQIVVDELIRARQTFINDIGANNHVFVWGDRYADDIEIQRHIDALDVVLSWYATSEQLKEIGITDDQG